MKIRTFALLLLVCVALASPATASTEYPIGPFILDVRSAGESFYEPYSQPHPPSTATGDFSQAEMDSIMGGMNYWVERIGEGQGAKIIINLAKIDDPSGTAYSWTPETGRPYSDVYNSIVGGAYYAPAPFYGYHTEIIFNVPYTTVVTRQLLDDASITSTITHELMHALDMGGVLIGTDESAASWDLTPWTINAKSAWGSRLYDVNGRRAVDGDIVFDPAISAVRSNGVFVMPDFNADPTSPMATHPGQVTFFPTFHGDAVDALTNGQGMPVMAGLGDDYELDEGNTLGHPALLGSIMSYSPLRNMLFTEVELAVLKDMGYQIDLKKFFGKSYYPSRLGGLLTTDTAMPLGRVGAYLDETALSVTNTDGFRGDASYATGLHVYRDRLNVTQAADISAGGHGAGGIRVDGVGNTVTVPTGVTVAADGSYGTGLLVSYGKENVVDIQGVVRAEGEMGIGAHFGIGMSGITSYFYQAGADARTNSDDRYFYTKMNSDLNGALVNALNVSGELSGTYAAVMVEADAHVENINFLRGADVDGDIRSEWNPWNIAAIAPNPPEDYATDLTFGVTMLGAGDPGFNMRYDGTISGPASFNLHAAGGDLSLNGSFSGLETTVHPGATLRGSATYFLYGDGTAASQAAPGAGLFTNNGVVAPGNSIGTISIAGDFTNNGDLLMEFNADGESDQLNVTGVFAHNAGGGATVTVTPEQDYYSGATTIPFAGMFSGGAGSTLPSVIDTFLPFSSPTLTMTMSPGAPYTVTTTRAAGAYSRYASGRNGAQVGAAIDTLSGTATGDMQDLVAALDFSAPSGATISSALDQLSPEAYNSAAQTSLTSNRMLSGSLLRVMLQAPHGQETGLNGGDETSEWSAFLMPVGGTRFQRAHGDALGYSATDAGLFGGMERHFDSGLTAGMHAAVIHSRVDVHTEDGASTETDSLHLGAQALMRPPQWNGAYLYGIGRVGVENAETRRSVSFGGFQRTADAEWTGLTSAANLGAGYDWQLGAVALGPLAGLDYAFTWRPDVTEQNGGAARLKTESKGYHSLRSALGAHLDAETRFNERAMLRAGLSAQWMHALVNEASATRASFADGSQSFEAQSPAPGRDSLALMGDVGVLQDDALSLNLFAGTELFQTGYSSLQGGCSVNWNF
ncbi:MAG TPA: autotransporter domain-containing protein [Desulfovibrio sp.]|uniref:autotransporter outer membrane beta-barrel domain-containing protein n=1 Tax=Desulfovibrio sp. TaxID=885 RepID=UPI002BCB5887|nr:autotransporter domain-containing protein [Desulfovibrio sp.]HMM38528.1 autotransporter domain-containing protein [Desulfovibrio sp.]